MNTLKVEAALARKYKYQPLTKELSQKYREYFEENIPSFFQAGNTQKLYTGNGSLICDGYERIVIGDYGAFVEFNVDQANKATFSVAKGQEYRISDPKYKNVKYYWYTINDGSNIKIYFQRRRVPYADYKPRMFYVSVHEAFKE